jgi:hypothetical protein
MCFRVFPLGHGSSSYKIPLFYTSSMSVGKKELVASATLRARMRARGGKGEPAGDATGEEEAVFIIW